ncbi:17722_t:CDS:1, partial [Racocetra persica]
FATILLFCNPVYPERLWEKYFSTLTDDFYFQILNNTNATLTDTNISNQALLYLQSILNKHEKSLSDFSNMPLPTISPTSNILNHLIAKELNYNIEELTQIIEHG